MLSGADGVCVRAGHHIPPGFQREVQAVQGGPNVDQIGQELPSANGVTREREVKVGKRRIESGERSRTMFLFLPYSALMGQAGFSPPSAPATLSTGVLVVTCCSYRSEARGGPGNGGGRGRGVGTGRLGERGRGRGVNLVPLPSGEHAHTRGEGEWKRRGWEMGSFCHAHTRVGGP